MTEAGRFDNESLVAHVKVRVYRPEGETRTSLCGEKFKKGKDEEGKPCHFCDIPFHQAAEKSQTFQSYRFSDPFLPGPNGQMIPLGAGQGVVLPTPTIDNELLLACDFPGCGFTTKTEAGLHSHKRIHKNQFTPHVQEPSALDKVLAQGGEGHGEEEKTEEDNGASTEE